MRSPGDALNALLCGAGHNLRMILRALWLFLARILCFWVMSMNPTNSRNSKFNYLSVWSSKWVGHDGLFIGRPILIRFDALVGLPSLQLQF